MLFIVKPFLSRGTKNDVLKRMAFQAGWLSGMLLVAMYAFFLIYLFIVINFFLELFWGLWPLCLLFFPTKAMKFGCGCRLSCL